MRIEFITPEGVKFSCDIPKYIKLALCDGLIGIMQGRLPAVGQVVPLKVHADGQVIEVTKGFARISRNEHGTTKVEVLVSKAET